MFDRLEGLQDALACVSAPQQVLSESLELTREGIAPDSIHDESPASGAEDLIQHKRCPFWPMKAEEKRSLLGAVAWTGKAPTKGQKVGLLMSVGAISA